MLSLSLLPQSTHYKKRFPPRTGVKNRNRYPPGKRSFWGKLEKVRSADASNGPA